jgi:hypothetical protein
MNMLKYIPTVCLFLSVVATGNGQNSKSPLSLGDKIKQFSPTVITGDITTLSAGDQKALEKLIEAARLMDSLYLRQVWSGNLNVLHKLEADTSPDGIEKLHYFRINMSPWSKLDGDEPFIEGVPQHPPKGANYYPENMPKEDFNSWVEHLPEPEQQKAKGFFYTIGRNADGSLEIHPYSEVYADYLKPAAQLLWDAAKLTDNPTLKTFLELRGKAFLSNDYYESDVAWMDLNSAIEPTIGPYEVYLDDLFNYKAAFEAFITLRDEEETNKLALFSTHLQEIEDGLPILPEYRNPKLGAMSPIRVVNEIAIGGESRAGVQTAAYNLPNDERVTQEKGSKRVMLKNVQEAKFNKCLVPISTIVLSSDQQAMVSFDPFFTHILAHELMHGLGPHTIMVKGKKTTVRQEMKEIGSALEEAKADIAGLFALQYLVDKGILKESMEKPLYVTFLASLFRSVRFGIEEAHGKGVALQFNYLSDEGGYIYNPVDGTYSVNFEKIKNAVRKLTGEIMTVQAEGNYDKAKSLLEKYGVIRPEMKAVLDKLTGIPVDIEPSFPLAK